ncbi:MAG: PorP/SprF family type IX secretion system membrane protein [Bacteroidota bacterium]
MRKIFFYILIAIFVCITAIDSHAQQVQFSQYYSASLHLNPAIAGIYSTPSFHVGYRRQISGNPDSDERFINDLSQASLILPVKKKRSIGMPNGGIGILGYTNSAGPEGGIKTVGVFVNYAHNIQVGPVRGKETIILSVQSGFEQMRFDLNSQQWGSQYNPFLSGSGFFDSSLPVPFIDGFSQSPGYPVVNLGAMYFWNIERNFHTYRYSAFSGIAVNNINRPKNSFLGSDEEARLDVLYKYHGGFEFRFRSFDFLPTILGTYSNGFVRFNAGGTIAYDLQDTRRFVTSNTGMKIAFGVWHKWKDSFIFYAGFRSASLNIGISYDLSTTDVIDSQLIDFGPATEITLQYFFTKNSRKSRRASANPLF